MSLPVALQLWTVKQHASEDFAGTLKKVKEIGYDLVELAGLYGLTPRDIRTALRAAGVKAIAAHVPVEDLIREPEQTISVYKRIGVRYIVLPNVPEDMRPGIAEDYDAVLKQIAQIGQHCGEQGIELLYHNHDFEFNKMPDGTYGLDYMFERLPWEYLRPELDTGFVKAVGEEPTEYLKKYYGQVPVIHLKDYTEADNGDGTQSGTRDCPLGQGIQDIPAILDESVNCYVRYVVVEQDDPNELDEIEAAKQSRDYLRSLGW